MSPGENGRGSGAEPTTFCTSLSTSISRCRSNNIADRGDLYTPIWQAYLDQLVVATKFCVPANALRLLLLAEFNVLPTSHRFILVTTPFPVPRSPCPAQPSIPQIQASNNPRHAFSYASAMLLSIAFRPRRSASTCPFRSPLTSCL